MNDTWRLSEPNAEGLLLILDSGGNGRGGWLPAKDAAELVEIHNMSAPAEYLTKFREAALRFLTDEVRQAVDVNDEKTGRNYWAVALMMADSLTAQLAALVGYGGLLEPRPNPAKENADGKNA